MDPLGAHGQTARVRAHHPIPPDGRNGDTPPPVRMAHPDRRTPGRHTGRCAHPSTAHTHTAHTSTSVDVCATRSAGTQLSPQTAHSRRHTVCRLQPDPHPDAPSQTGHGASGHTCPHDMCAAPERGEPPGRAARQGRSTTRGKQTETARHGNRQHRQHGNTGCRWRGDCCRRILDTPATALCYLPVWFLSPFFSCTISHTENGDIAPVWTCTARTPCRKDMS